ncbi:hypothetical protein K438DRAFT_1561688, partial [Mycena galopus ATCC 62051]
MVNISVDSASKVSASNEIQDYALRDAKHDFDQLCLYDYISRAYKVKNIQVALRPQAIENPDQYGRFRTRHPQKDTHVVRLRKFDFIPVILGPRFPRPEVGAEEKEDWSRSMLMLFRPWRSKADLINENEAWVTAFDRTVFSDEHLRIMANIHVENECKDARDSH